MGTFSKLLYIKVFDDILPYDEAFNHVFNKYAWLPDDVRHVDAEAVHGTVQYIIQNSTDSRLVNESLCESSACFYIM